MNYQVLLSPGTIGPLRLKNRAVMVPMATDLADRHGVVTDRQIRYYQEQRCLGLIQYWERCA